MINNVAGIAQYLLSQLKLAKFRKPVSVDLSNNQVLVIVPRIKNTGTIWFGYETESIFEYVRDYSEDENNLLIAKYWDLDDYKVDHFTRKDQMDKLISDISDSIFYNGGMYICLVEVYFPPKPMSVPDMVLLPILEFVTLFSVARNSIFTMPGNIGVNSLISVYHNVNPWHLGRKPTIFTQMSKAYSTDQLGRVDKERCQRIYKRLKDLQKDINGSSDVVDQCLYKFTTADPILNTMATCELFDNFSSDIMHNGFTAIDACRKLNGLYKSEKFLSENSKEVLKSKYDFAHRDGVINGYARVRREMGMVYRYLMKDLQREDGDQSATTSESDS